MMVGYINLPRVHIINTYTLQKKGKITIPKHTGDLNPKTIKSIMQQAGLI